jgi:hypothetical protein
MPAKKTTKTAIKKTVATKTVAKKAPAKKAPAKKVAVTKVPTKKVAVTKVPAKKATKKVAPKKPATTTIIANVDVGFGNSLYIRGEGADLSWEKGTALENVSPYEWVFCSDTATGEVTFKFLINDEAWADDDDLTVAAGSTSVSSPVFSR